MLNLPDPDLGLPASRAKKYKVLLFMSHPSLWCSVAALSLLGHLLKLIKTSSSFLHHMDEKVTICEAQFFFTLQQSGQVGETFGSQAWDSSIKSGPQPSEITHLSTMALGVHAKSLQSCPTLWNSMDSSPPGSSVHGILWARILEWVAMPSSKGSSQPRYLLCLLHWQASSLPRVPPGKPHISPNQKGDDLPRHPHYTHSEPARKEARGGHFGKWNFQAQPSGTKRALRPRAAALP